MDARPQKGIFDLFSLDVRVWTSTARILLVALVALLSFFHTSSATAQTPCSSSITIQWFYGSTCYPNQAEAVAAMQSDPANPQNSTLTIMAGAASMSANTTQYKYTAPTPISITNGITVYWGGRGPTFPTESQAVSYIINVLNPPNQCGASTGTPAGAPIPSSNLGSPSFGPGFIQDYNETSWGWDMYTNPQCGQNTGGADFTINYWVTTSCPAYYTLSGSLCIDNYYAYISSTVLLCQNQSTLVGDPCDAASGEFTQTESDYAAAGLTLDRFYHSATLEQFHGFGVGWSHTYSSQLIVSGGVPVGLLRPNGHHDPLAYISSASYVTLSGDGIHVLPPNTSGNASSNYWAVLPDGSKEIYNTAGALIQLVSPGGAITTVNYTGGVLSSVVGPFGHTLLFTFSKGNITSITDPAGKTIGYSYDGSGNLSSVQYQDGTGRVYQYLNAAYPNNLTGILDENNASFLTVSYDSNGHASTSQNAGGANYVSLVFSATSATVTDGLGGSTVFNYAAPTGYSPRVTSVSYNSLTTSLVVPAPSADNQQRATQSTDPNGNISNFVYDSDHLKSKTEGYGTSVARTTSYLYLNVYSSLPTQITEPLKTTINAYYPGTNTVHTSTVTDTTVTPNVSRVWTYSYNSYGQVLTVDGPRTDVADVTTYTYYTCVAGIQCGQIDTVKDALGLITTYSTYNAHGQPLTITDPNGVVTTLTYDLRQHLLSRQVGAEKTQYQYWPTGLLQLVILPDGSTIQYGYDNAHRLTDITDGLGNHTHYVLDAMGNRTTDLTTDPSNSLKRTHARVFNILNQLYQDKNASGTTAVTTTYSYDNNGNLASIAAPLGRNTGNQYDSLNRLNNINDPMSGVTKLAYDANDRITNLIDPRSLSTTYNNNGFGDVMQLVSPDTGTSIRTYDSGGNVSTTTDARSALATYSYDALNRETKVVYGDQTISFSYDSGANGKGRLTGASDANHTLAWTYDPQGRINGKSQIVASVTKTVGYTYTNADLTSLVTPSGQSITYGYNNHQITSIQVGSTMLLSGVTYDPFGPVTGWTWGNSSTSIRNFDQDGNPSSIVTAGTTNAYTPDYAGRITQITDSTLSSNTWNFTGYDYLDRITAASSSAKTRSYKYDANGNRTNTGGSTPVTLNISPANNQITTTTGDLTRTYTYDKAGNASYTGETLSFNSRGRMSVAASSGGTTNYVYNALGQLIEKSGNGGTTLLMYDEAGHIIGEYSSTGALIQETIWMGDMPVATLRPNGSAVSIYYVHTNHLGAPVKVTRPSDSGLMWRWDPDTFGSSTSSPNQNPAGLGTFVYNLRFPGQYALPESGLNYNYFRDYDPQTGRYLESDPIGLAGGSYSTYSYTNNNPISGSDPLGLLVRGGGLSNQQWSAIERAEAKIRKELSKSCSCHKDSSKDGCIPCDQLEPLLNKLETMAVAELPLAGECGWTPPFPNPKGIFLAPGAFSGKKCSGCLASTIYHELLHTTGLLDIATVTGPAVPDLESQCIGNLCKSP